MVNGLGVVGWGVGGIEAEAAMLGQPISMLIPEVVGFRLVDRLPEGATATDLVLTITERLRKFGVVGKFVEFYGPGLEFLTIADRATLGNMSPEYGATIAICPIDEMTLDYLRLTGRDEAHVKLVEAYAKEQGLFRTRMRRIRLTPRRLELDLSTVEPSLAGPKRPQDRVSLRQCEDASFSRRSRRCWRSASRSVDARGSLERTPRQRRTRRRLRGRGGRARRARHGRARSRLGRGRGDHELHQHVESERHDRRRAAGPQRRQARPEGEAVGEDEPRARLAHRHRVPARRRACSNISPSSDSTSSVTAARRASATAVRLPEPVSSIVRDKNLVVASVLSGNRNFEGRIQSQVRANYLASPPLVVAYALAGKMQIDLTTRAARQGLGGQAVYLRDIWPTEREIQETMLGSVKSEMFRSNYAEVFDGDERWRSLPVPTGSSFEWDGRLDLHPQPAVFRRPDARADAAVRHLRRARAGACSATASQRTTFRRPDRFRPTVRPDGI